MISVLQLEMSFDAIVNDRRRTSIITIAHIETDSGELKRHAKSTVLVSKYYRLFLTHPCIQ